MGSEKRRHDRFVVILPVRLVVGKQSSTALTVDVSFGGLFVRSSDPPPLRQLVKVEMNLPPKDAPISIMAMAVFVEEDKGQRERGVGLQLFGLDPATRERWEGFVKHIRTLPKAEKVDRHRAEQTPIEDAPPDWNKIRPEIRITVRDVTDLERILHREIARGRIYVRTSLFLASGRQVALKIAHPLHERTFVLLGQVDQQVKRPDFEGLRILLPEPEAEEVEAYQSFMKEQRSPTMDLEGDAIGDADLIERNQAS